MTKVLFFLLISSNLFSQTLIGTIHQSARDFINQAGVEKVNRLNSLVYQNGGTGSQVKKEVSTIWMFGKTFTKQNFANAVNLVQGTGEIGTHIFPVKNGHSVAYFVVYSLNGYWNYSLLQDTELEYVAPGTKLWYVPN